MSYSVYPLLFQAVFALAVVPITAPTKPSAFTHVDLPLSKCSATAGQATRITHNFPATSVSTIRKRPEYSLLAQRAPESAYWNAATGVGVEAPMT